MMTFILSLALQGQRVYETNCIACHNINPTIAGDIGPALADTDYLVIQVKVMTAGHPAYYTPKRNTHIMPAMPWLESDIPAIAAYLNRGR